MSRRTIQTRIASRHLITITITTSSQSLSISDHFFCGRPARIREI